MRDDEDGRRGSRGFGGMMGMMGMMGGMGRMRSRDFWLDWFNLLLCFIIMLPIIK